MIQSIVKADVVLCDYRTHFNYEQTEHGEMSFRHGDVFHVVCVGKTKSSLVAQTFNAEAKTWKSGGGGGVKFEEKPVQWQVVKSSFLLDYPTFFD